MKKNHIDDLEFQVMELEDKIKDLNAKLNKKEIQLQMYHYQFTQAGNFEAEDCVGLTLSEKEFYSGEIKDVALRTFEKERIQWIRIQIL